MSKSVNLNLVIDAGEGGGFPDDDDVTCSNGMVNIFFRAKNAVTYAEPFP